MTIDGKGIGVSLELSNWSKCFSCSFSCFLKYLCNAMMCDSVTVTCFISVSLDYGHVQIPRNKFGNFNIGELLKYLPILKGLCDESGKGENEREFDNCKYMFLIIVKC